MGIERRALGGGAGSQSANTYAAPNPEFGATFTYYLKDGLKTRKAQRKEQEKALKKDKKPIPVPAWDKLEAEEREQKPTIWFTIRDDEGNVVRKMQGAGKKGINRATWDLRYPPHQSVTQKGSFFAPNPQGMMVAPGTYTVSMSKEVDGKLTELQAPQSFNIVAMHKNGALKPVDGEKVAAFWQELAKVQRVSSATSEALKLAIKRLGNLEKSLDRTMAAPGDFDQQFAAIRTALLSLDSRLNGNAAKKTIGAWSGMSVGERLSQP